jgi:probable HAF family extracellular repeat protein
VLGSEVVAGRETTVRWSRSGGPPTPLPFGEGQLIGDINSRGDVVGQVGASAALLPVGASQPVLLAGGAGPSVATAINDAGAVVGWVTAADGQRHAAHWAAGTHAFTDLGVLDGVSAVAEDINNAGVVVGTVTEASGYTAAARFAAPTR